MINTPPKELQKSTSQMHPAFQFVTFIGIVVIIYIAGNIIGAGLVWGFYGLKTLTAIGSLNLAAPHAITALWVLQFTGATLPIFAAPVFFAYVVVHNPSEFIRPNFRFPWVLMVIVLGISLIAFPLIEFLSDLNQKMALPPFLHWMRDFEDNAEKLTNAMLQMKTVWDLIFDLAFIGLLTAIAEEFMFRGCLQTILVKWTKNVHVAVWVTAILFSAFHMEFFGFLPRVLLGAIFGYLVVWSGSIWPAVWAHFINNGSDVIITYLSQHKMINFNADDQHLFNNAEYVFSFIIILFLCWFYRNITTKSLVPQ
jgi:membrane protease YdiL (CAAX protease family)